MSDLFKHNIPGLESPAIGAAELAPNDETDLETVSRALNAKGAGTVRVTMIDGSVATLSIGDGAILPVRVTKVWATGTTATGLVALF